MGRRRPFSPDFDLPEETTPSVNSEESPPSVGVQLLGHRPGGVDLDSVDASAVGTSNPKSQRGALVPVVGLLGLAFFVLYLLGASTPTEQAESSAVVDSPTPDSTVDRTVLEATARSEEELALAAEQFERAKLQYELNELSRVDDDLLGGLVLGWIRDNDQLAVVELDTGIQLDVSTLARHDLPPLPKHIQLIGAENATWLIDLVDPEYSGKLSNSVRMVRLGSELDSYGFISESEDGGPTDFFVGSLWGPSMNGTAQTPNSWTILPVPGSGIVVSSPTAESSSLRGSGLEPFPRNVGRVVAATTNHLAGVSCDNRLQCVGVVSQWDGTDQEVLDANALSRSATVRISPDGNRLVSVIGDTWTVFDLANDETRQFATPLPVDSSLTWTPDSNALVWIIAGTVVAVDVDGGYEDSLEPTVVLGGVGERLPNSDVVVYDVEMVISTAAVTG